MADPATERFDAEAVRRPKSPLDGIVGSFRTRENMPQPAVKKLLPRFGPRFVAPPAPFSAAERQAGYRQNLSDQRRRPPANDAAGRTLQPSQPSGAFPAGTQPALPENRRPEPEEAAIAATVPRRERDGRFRPARTAVRSLDGKRPSGGKRASPA